MLSFLLSLVLLGSSVPGTPFLPVPLTGLTVVVDPGHGGVDPGAHFRREMLEKDVVLDIGRNLAELLREAGARVVVTRDGDHDLAPNGMRSLASRKRFDLRERVMLAQRNGADILVSLHVNSHPSSQKSGSFVFYNQRPEARDMALAVQKELNRLFPAGGSVLSGANLYILRQSSMPAIIVEAGFMSNPAERKSLAKAAFRRQVAWSVFAGLERYLQEHRRPEKTGGILTDFCCPPDRPQAGIALGGLEYRLRPGPGPGRDKTAGRAVIFEGTGELDVS